MEPHPSVLFLLGASHHSAPLAVREKLALDDARAAALAARLRTLPGIREFAFLNTCNRVEIYGVADGREAIGALREALCELTGCATAAFDTVSRLRQNHEAIAHLFGVASGLASQIVGETEILGQVKEAYEAALSRKWTGPVLNRVFQKTFQAAKQVRTQTAVGAGQISVASVAVDLAEKIFGSLAPVRVLVVGAGDIGLKTVQAFRSRGAKSITVASRALARAEEAAAAAGGWAASLADLGELLVQADVVASSTSAPDAIVTTAMTAAAMQRRPTRPLFLIDLAVPRDVEPGAAELPNVFLYNLDDLAEVAEENLARRKAEVARAQALLADRTAALWHQIAPALHAAAAPERNPT